jgi:hypothetical protein
MNTSTAKLPEVQARFDRLLMGTQEPLELASRSNADDRLFAEFLPEDKNRAVAMAGLCMKIAEEAGGGIAGLAAAADELKQKVGTCPDGMTEYAAKLFLTHYKPARELLQLRSLEERQPLSVRPSNVRPTL